MISANNNNNSSYISSSNNNLNYSSSNVDESNDHRPPTSVVADKLVQLSKAFDQRTRAVKAELIRANGEGFHDSSALPSVGDSDEEDKKCADQTPRNQPSATPVPQEKNSPFCLDYRPPADTEEPSHLWGTLKRGVVDTSTPLYRFWLVILSFTFLYNFWAITLRASFPQYHAGDKMIGWLVVDYVCDVVVLCDIIFVKPRLAFYENGLVVYDKKVLRKAYLTSNKFKLDILAMLPLDLCYLAVGRIQPLFRIPRLFNVRYYFEMFDRFDRSSMLPEVFRMLKTVIYILMAVHLYTCVYYLFSEKVGISHDKFVYEGGHWPAYARCFFVTFKMATRIGGQEKEPHTNPERGLMALFWLIALFVEIVLLAQVREIFLSVTKEDDEFGLLLSTALAYVRRYKCPVEIEKKVRDWFTYTRETQKTLDEHDVLQLLPKHLRTDLAFDIHYALLSKVSIFDNCERSVLSDVVVKLKVEMFFPNDIIYKKGDVGKQMYIIEKGQAEVIDDSGRVVATLIEGAVFGERSLLSLGASNRRHVTVRSKGYSNLFVLSKDDFQEIMVHHPKLYRRLRKKALSVPNAKIESSLGTYGEQKVTDLAPAQPIVNVAVKVARPGTPKLLRLMLKILPVRSSVIKRMMKVHPLSRDDVASDTDSPNYDPEIAALHWSSPSPDNFYIHQEWELRHYRVRPPTPIKQESVEESAFSNNAELPADAAQTAAGKTTHHSNDNSNNGNAKGKNETMNSTNKSQKNESVATTQVNASKTSEHISTITTFTMTTSSESTSYSRPLKSPSKNNAIVKAADSVESTTKISGIKEAAVTVTTTAPKKSGDSRKSNVSALQQTDRSFSALL